MVSSFVSGSVARWTTVAAIAAVAWSAIGVQAQAATTKKKRLPPPPAVERSVSGTIIQPTTTIIPGPNGQRTVIVVPRKRSYLDTGTEVSVGDRGFMDYMLPPGGDPGRPNWFFGPDVGDAGGYPLPRSFYLPGFNPDTPF